MTAATTLVHTTTTGDAPAPVACDCTDYVGNAARLPGDAVASVWECEECGNQTPFDAADYAFVNASFWRPAPPAGINPFAWLGMDAAAQVAALRAV